MAKLGFLLLLMVCVHASLAGHGHSKRKSNHGAARKIGWGSEGGADKPWAGNNHWARESEEGRHDHRMKSPEDMSNMAMFRMRMKKMLKPLRDLFVKVLDLGPKETVVGRPDYCGDNECPEFKVLNKSEHYESRMYQSSQWISTSVQTKRMSKMVSMSCFWRLFKYIRGNNELKQKIKMTVPVTNEIIKDPTAKMVNVTMSFFLPPSITTPPTPNDDTVRVERKGSFKVYVHGFGGYAMSQKTWEKHAKMLQGLLDRDGLAGKYHTPDEMYVTAGYNDPTKLFNRHNEVWLLAKDQED